MRKLTGDDARRAEELNQAIEAATKADRWGEAIARSEELLALRTKAQGPRHFETVDEECRLKTLRRVAPMTPGDRAAYRSARTLNDQALALADQGKYAQAQPLFEKALEIHRRLFTDDHPDTATYYNNLADNLATRGSTRRPSRSTRRRWRSPAGCSPTTTPIPPSATATWRPISAPRGNTPRPSRSSRRPWRSTAGYSPTITPIRPPATTTWPTTSKAQGRYAQAQPLFEKALEINRRLLTDDHPYTVTCYNNLAGNLHAQGKYAAGPAAGGEGAGCRPPSARRRPPLDRRQLQQPGKQPQ